MKTIDLEQFDATTVNVPGRDGTKLAVWMLRQDKNVTFDDVKSAAKKLQLPVSGRSWGAARVHVGLKQATPSRRRVRLQDNIRAAVGRHGNGNGPERGTALDGGEPVRAAKRSRKGVTGLPLDLVIHKLDSLETDIQDLRSTLQRIRTALYGSL